MNIITHTPETEVARRPADERDLAKALGAIMCLQARVLALEQMCVSIWAQQNGATADEFQRVLSKITQAQLEKDLLDIGDADPELAKILDITNRLNRGNHADVHRVESP